MALLRSPAGRPGRGVALGTVIVVATVAVLWPLHSHLTRATPGLVLVLAVVAAALVGGRWAAWIVAAEAAVGFSLLSEPVGSLRVALEEDLVALGVFVGVALVVSTLVAGRVDLLEEIDRQRRALLRSVSHDLRTPLSAIRAAASELQDDTPHDARTRAELLEMVGDEAERLDRMVGNLLSLSRIEAGAMVPRLQAVDLGELVQHTAHRLRRVFAQVELRVDVPDDVPLLSLDYAQMDQVVSNLLENAARHSPPGGEIVAAIDVEPTTVRLTVSDQGPGVEPELRPLLFQPFRSGRVAGSSGMGLAICRAVVEAHGGTISLGGTSASGACFTVSLPRRRARETD